ncbi:uncharacterized protein SAPINGB_P005616 [Magnusiomyces paraingens]|uniref:AAA+ ATPase domain-containing protein n=1 Tax=Magnusiomyces paraingens TaxID=2606893 RepID=A0A5E8C2N3_9ASCO|nr:uncharacterized protein SAPINGB_P005616 [Saprochaete ingens]VVT57260.1 unnamed protein product [Saprochaete ingens]
MLFYGPPGTGKTSTILALAKDLFGPDLMKTRVLELNASDERGISIVREKVKNFAKIAISQVSATAREKYPCPPYKIVILDEADSMTSDAQSALRRTMELYSDTTRFCLICNYVTRIIDPIASRCAKFRFKSLDETNALYRLEFIAQKESLKYEPKVLEFLLKISGGDLRKAITFLQSVARLTTVPIPNETLNDINLADQDGDVIMAEDSKSTPPSITVKMIQEIAGVIPDDVIDSIIISCTSKSPSNNSAADFGSKVFKNVLDLTEKIMLDGWSATQILAQLHDRIIFDDNYSSSKKIKFSWVISEADKRLSDGTDEYLEVLNVLAKFAIYFYN